MCGSSFLFPSPRINFVVYIISCGSTCHANTSLYYIRHALIWFDRRIWAALWHIWGFYAPFWLWFLNIAGRNLKISIRKVKEEAICAELGTKTRTKWHFSSCLFFLFLRLLMVVILLVWLTRVSYAPAETRGENQFLKSKLSTIIRFVSIPRLNK